METRGFAGGGGSVVDSAAAVLGLVAQTVPPHMAQSEFPLGAGTLVFVLGYLPAVTVSALGTWVGSQAAAATDRALLTNYATPPKVAGTSAIVNVPAINGRYQSVYLTGQTSFPASFNPAAATLNSGGYYLTVS